MIGVTRDKNVTVIEIRRPDKRNALDVPTMRELTEACEEASANKDVRAVVLTGQGTSFCAGVDLSATDPEQGPTAHMTLLQSLAATPIPVIAAVNGPAVGAGVQLTLVTDLRIIAPEAFIQIPTAKIGVTYDPRSLRLLVHLVGLSKARMMLYTAEKITAEEALSCGFANKIGNLDSAVELAHHIASLSPLSLQLTKRILKEDFDRPVNKEHAQAAEALLFSDDVKEALIARMEKRPPRFEGK